jgi:hypothetical protein
MKFTPNKPIETKDSTITVDRGLSVGSHRFRLVVENDRGQRSRPAEVVVKVEANVRIRRP